MDAQIQRALAHPKRTEILGYLIQRGGGKGADESELAGSLGLTRVNVRYHLAVLHDAELISHTDGLGSDVPERYMAAASADN